MMLYAHGYSAWRKSAVAKELLTRVLGTIFPCFSVRATTYIRKVSYDGVPIQLRENLTRRVHISRQRGDGMLPRDHKMALRLEWRDHLAPPGAVSPEAMH